MILSQVEHFIFSQHQQPTEIKSEEAQEQGDGQYQLRGQQQEEREAGAGRRADRGVILSHWEQTIDSEFSSILLGSFHLKRPK